jgi:hypothetical protein
MMADWRNSRRVNQLESEVAGLTARVELWIGRYERLLDEIDGVSVSGRTILAK